MGPGELDSYLPAAVLGAALLARLPGLLRGWRSPTVRTVNALLFLPCLGFVLSAPPTVTAVNRFTGISNVSALLVHCVMTAYACATLVLLTHWRSGSEDQARTRRRVRTWRTGCCVVIAALVVLFALGDVPVEQPRNFDTYYAATPYISGMLVLYLLAYVVAGVAMALVCGNWMRDIGRTADRGSRTTVDRFLWIGLLVLATGAVGNIVFGSFKLTAIAARWAGRDWDALNESLSPFMAVCGMVIGFGLMVPVYGPGLVDRVWRPLLHIHALRPLWQLVRRSLPTAGKRPFPAPSWYAGPEQVLLYRMTAVHDWMLDLSAYCADEIRERSYLRAKGAGAPEREAVAAGLAAMYVAAADVRAREPAPLTERCAPVVVAVCSAGREDRDLLVSISRALAAYSADDGGRSASAVGG
ncbi:MAB_1171c family putative transporter [Streptomyces sp. NPDC057680]|uniref:MAB_1171c family putative transporter n=1 Tax=Streptomyces sp. NPDC057680 TaxID=3346208 RepID=UPI0036794EB9